MHRTSIRASLGAGLAVMFLAAACGGGGAATPTPAAPTLGAATVAPPSIEVTQAPTSTQGATGPANIDAPAEVQAGTQFDVSWTGPNAQGDYITIVKSGATKWTNEAYFDTLGSASPRKLTAPSADGAYELWYVAGADASIQTRRPIKVLPFQGDLLGPDSVMAGSIFEVSWHGPDGPGDYVTIVKSGATQWTNESYFYTNVGSPGKLTADIEPGSYELWYVIGSDSAVKSRRPITLTPYAVTLSAPATVAKGAQFQVAWTGPNGPQDYITIVPAGSPPGTYLSYAYTQNGSPVTLTAPTDSGSYEIWYASDRVKDLVFGKTTIKVN